MQAAQAGHGMHPVPVHTVTGDAARAPGLTIRPGPSALTDCNKKGANRRFNTRIHAFNET